MTPNQELLREVELDIVDLVDEHLMTLLRIMKYDRPFCLRLRHLSSNLISCRKKVRDEEVKEKDSEDELAVLEEVLAEPPHATETTAEKELFGEDEEDD